ncbi:FMN-binding protein [Candidatus Latescibacterota bacterium]
MNSRAWMIGLLIIMAIVCSSSLALVNNITSPIIEKNNEIKYMRTVLDVFDLPYDSENDDSIIGNFEKNIEDIEEQGLVMFKEIETGSIAVSVEGGGFQGNISIVVALDSDTIKGFKVVAQEETPGLGGRISEEGFQNSFVGKKVSGGIRMTRSGNAGTDEFDAIAGATETSRAVEKILNSGFERYFEVVKK